MDWLENQHVKSIMQKQIFIEYDSEHYFLLFIGENILNQLCIIKVYGKWNGAAYTAIFWVVDVSFWYLYGSIDGASSTQWTRQDAA